MNMYEQYIYERENLHMIQTDHGFITYKIEFPNCLISDCFVLKEFRKNKYASFLADQVLEICKGAGVKTVYCQTDDKSNDVATSITSISKFGFSFVRKEDSISYFKLEL